MSYFASDTHYLPDITPMPGIRIGRPPILLSSLITAAVTGIASMAIIASNIGQMPAIEPAAPAQPVVDYAALATGDTGRLQVLTPDEMAPVISADYAPYGGGQTLGAELTSPDTVDLVSALETNSASADPLVDAADTQSLTDTDTTAGAGQVIEVAGSEPVPAGPPMVEPYVIAVPDDDQATAQ